MTEISIPYHLIHPLVISILILGLIFWKRTLLFNQVKWKGFWTYFTIFVSVYFLLLGATICYDIQLKMNLQSFDLDGNGLFSGNEITPEQIKAMKLVTSDTARNFAMITSLLFSGIITVSVFIIGKIINFIRR